MKKRRNRAIEKAKLPHEKAKLNWDNVKLINDSEWINLEGFSVNVDISREDKDLTVTSPYTTPTPPPGYNLDNIFSESTEEIMEVEAKSVLVKVKDLFKGIFKR